MEYPKIYKKGGRGPKKPNSQECCYFGRKLSAISCDQIEVSAGYIVIGSPADDQIFFYKNERGELILPAQSLKERVVITCMNDGPTAQDNSGWCFDIDLEDVLRFAAQNCRGIFMRVLREETLKNSSENGSILREEK